MDTSSSTSTTRFRTAFGAELLHDRKFEQGDRNHDGVCDGWEPEERITDRYWELVNGQGPSVRYRVDHQDYEGGASQAIELHGAGSNHASVYQIGLRVARGSTTFNVQGIVGINPVAVKLTPPYFAYLLYRNHIGDSMLATTTEGPMTSFNSRLPALDAIATFGEDSRRINLAVINLAVINRSEANDISTTIQIRGGFTRRAHWRRCFC